MIPDSLFPLHLVGGIRMLVNEFIDKMLVCLSLVIPRLEDPISRLQIQTEMQNDTAYRLISYFTMLQPEYKYFWKQINAHQPVSIRLDITSMNQYQELCDYLITWKLLTPDDIIWLDDAIHEVLIYDD